MGVAFNKLIFAFLYLKERISHGVEYPDAEWGACKYYKLSNEEINELRRMYDEEQSNNAKTT